jgi:hypothetical protein
MTIMVTVTTKATSEVREKDRGKRIKERESRKEDKEERIKLKREFYKRREFP